MRCALVFYLVATILGVVYGVPKLCAFGGDGGLLALCEQPDIRYSLRFIPPISENISFIDLRGQPFEQLPYNGFGNLSSQSNISVIVLRHCEIRHIDAGALFNLHNLTTIDLSYNRINQIDRKLFSDTKRIKFIDMGHNGIEVLPNGLFQNLVHLEVVFLEHNLIHRVERFSFKNTPSLRIIDLDNNQIEFMSMSFKDKFHNFAILWLADNPWRCNCELGPLYEFLMQINQLNQYGLVCENPPTLQGRKWSDISRYKFVCRSEDEKSAQDSVRTKQVATGIPQPPSNQNWFQRKSTILVLLCVAAAAGIITVVILRRRSHRRTNARNMTRGLPMFAFRSSAVSDDGDSS